jgi:hypothetical protein
MTSIFLQELEAKLKAREDKAKESPTDGSGSTGTQVQTKKHKA